MALLLMAACSRTPSQLPAGAPQQSAGNVPEIDAEIGSPLGTAASMPQADETTPLSDAALIAMGDAIYAGNCAPCHQPNGEGTLSLFPALNRNAFVMVSDPTGLIEIVLHGQQVMPAFEPTLSAQEVAAVLSYVRNAWNNQAPVVSEAQVRQVQAGEAQVSEVQAREPAQTASNR